MTRFTSFIIVVFVLVVSAGCDAKSSFAPTPPPLPGLSVPPAFAPLRCSPDGAATVAGNKVTFAASGGDGSYTWSAPGGSPSSGTGGSFTTIFHRGGKTEYVAVASGDGQSAKCEIGVALPPQ